jgi:hypothetical protein
VHPGAIPTDLARHLTPELIDEVTNLATERAPLVATHNDEVEVGITWKSIEAGAATQTWAATTSELAMHNGSYLADCALGVLGGNPGVNGFLPYLLDDDHAATLWELSEELVGVSFAP